MLQFRSQQTNGNFLFFKDSFYLWNLLLCLCIKQAVLGSIPICIKKKKKPVKEKKYI